MNKKDVIVKLKKIKPYLQNEFGLKELALFGSTARSENKVGSDIDLFIDLDKNTSSDFFNIAFSLQDLFTPMTVDIVTKRGIKEEYFKMILDDLIYV